MKDPEKWMQLCEDASREQNPKRLMALTAEIIRLLNEKDEAAKPEGDRTPQS